MGQISATNVPGETVSTVIVPEGASIADVRRRLAEDLSVSHVAALQLVLPHPRERTLDALDDGSLAADVFFGPHQPMERRLDRDGRPYTRTEFLQCYGTRRGRQRWSQARQR